jgi:hypothetical protein
MSGSIASHRALSQLAHLDGGLMSGPTRDLGGLGAGASMKAGPEAPEPTSGPAWKFYLCQRVISWRESLFAAARQT